MKFCLIKSSPLGLRADTEVQIDNKILINIVYKDVDATETAGFAIDIKFATKSEYHIPPVFVKRVNFLKVIIIINSPDFSYRFLPVTTPTYSTLLKYVSCLKRCPLRGEVSNKKCVNKLASYILVSNT
jgi:hypothetical protein